MTTAQDQQSRAVIAAWNAQADEHNQWGTLGDDEKIEWAMQAARALPAPENVREGEPYDNPAFEDLARTMGVWGTAQAALCAQFFLAGRGAVPAGDDGTPSYLAQMFGPGPAPRPPAAQERKPLFWVRLLRDGLYEGPVHANSVGGKMMRDEKPDEWHPLYLGTIDAAHGIKEGGSDAG